VTLPQADRLAIEFVEDFTIIEFLDEEISQVFCVSDDVQEIGSQIDQLVESLRPRRLLLDFARVEFMASFMQAYLLGLQKRLERAGGRLILCGLTDQVDQSFRITNLHRVFEILSNRNAALDLEG
jgi:anti-anti-sigma factor